MAKGSILGASHPLSAVQSIVSMWSAKVEIEIRRGTFGEVKIKHFVGGRKVTPVKILPKANWSTGGFGFISVRPA